MQNESVGVTIGDNYVHGENRGQLRLPFSDDPFSGPRKKQQAIGAVYPDGRVEDMRELEKLNEMLLDKDDVMLRKKRDSDVLREEHRVQRLFTSIEEAQQRAKDEEAGNSTQVARGAPSPRGRKSENSGDVSVLVKNISKVFRVSANALGDDEGEATGKRLEAAGSSGMLQLPGGDGGVGSQPASLGAISARSDFYFTFAYPRPSQCRNENAANELEICPKRTGRESKLFATASNCDSAETRTHLCTPSTVPLHA